MCEKDLPVSFAQAKHEKAQEVDNTSAPENQSEIASIQSSTGESADAEDQKDLERTDP